MITITIDGNKITDINALHECIGEQIELPPYYGKNLDALRDVLTEDNYRIIIENRAELRKNLGRRGNAVIRMLDDINKANEN